MQLPLVQIALELLAIVPLRSRVLERVPRKHLVFEALWRAALAHGHGCAGEEGCVAVRGLRRVVVEARAAEVGELGGEVEEGAGGGGRGGGGGGGHFWGGLVVGLGGWGVGCGCGVSLWRGLDAGGFCG